ncbi:YopN/LcrE/InvE/MxiC type III secretion system gatekeeper [Escherichia coli]|uniref:YopN/LcrE/InvE/MxiC type III secretion system gatekeeper n=1 Tax=Escherichia coli TaxID=562 RepID=UPI0008F4DDE5|nr:YopN/LcrE/InvE/MxiC type III secretion system gatekeeper [Escherichia coli]OII98309.1 type III secretion system protein [Escherichia coli]OWC37808.1 type III secretion system protein [Escherichia coli]RCP48319.1 YopN family type III secretion system gatekeeper subunit [Escherichia coli]HAH2722883.1 YopN family type III secretion system gatekeeper subunit [Escherichia coli]HAH8993368.1 YopN/LcrE/InvE/MxiC type III secretion system gatekeeper [Escherichia coli]
MAIHVEHVGVLERAREVSRLEDIITEDNEDIEAEMPKMGDDPAGKEARFLQATDEMSAALTQFMKKKIYEEQLANFLDGEEYVLEDQPIEKTDKVMEALKAATTHDYEVYSFAKKLFPDESDLVVVLRAILRKKQISENVRLNAEALLRKVNQETTKKFINSGINSALKAKLFGQALSLNPKLLRASYRQFLMAEDDAVDTYVEWIGSYGYQNRMLVTKFIKETLFSDINALDASCSSLEFGMFLNKLSQLLSLQSAEALFLKTLMNNPIIKKFISAEDYWIFFLISLIKFPETVEELLNNALVTLPADANYKDKTLLLKAIYSGCTNLPFSLFINNEQLLEIRECCKQAIKVTFAAELFDTQNCNKKQNKKPWKKVMFNV